MQGAQIKYMVTRQYISVFVHTKATVSVSVIGKAYVKVIFLNVSCKPLYMGRSAFLIDIGSVGTIVYHENIGTHCRKNR